MGCTCASLRHIGALSPSLIAEHVCQQTVRFDEHNLRNAMSLYEWNGNTVISNASMTASDPDTYQSHLDSKCVHTDHSILRCTLYFILQDLHLIIVSTLSDDYGFLGWGHEMNFTATTYRTVNFAWPGVQVCVCVRVCVRVYVCVCVCVCVCV